MAEDYGVSLKITADTSDLDKIPQKVDETQKKIEKPVAQPAPVKVNVEQPEPVTVKVAQDPDPLKIKVELPDPSEIEAAIPKKDFHVDVQPQLDPSKLQAIPPINIPSNPVKPKVDPSEAIQGFNAIKASMDVLHGNFAGLAMELAKLSNGAGLLKTIGVSGFLAIGGAIMGVMSSARSLRDLFATLFNVGTVGRDISSIGANLVDIGNKANAFADAMNDARKAADLVNQSLEKEIAALGRVAQAQSEINRQRELSAATSDEERAQVHARYDQQAADIGSSTAQQSADLKRKALTDEIDRIQKELAQSQETEQAYRQQAANARARAEENILLTDDRRKEGKWGAAKAGTEAWGQSIRKFITHQATSDDKAQAALAVATKAENAADDEVERRAELEERLEKARHDLKIANLEEEARIAKKEADDKKRQQDEEARKAKIAEKQTQDQADFARERGRTAADAEFEDRMRAAQRRGSAPDATEAQRNEAENAQVEMLREREESAKKELAEASARLDAELKKPATVRDEKAMSRAREDIRAADSTATGARRRREDLEASAETRRASVAQDYFGNLAREIDASRPKNRLTAMGLGSGAPGDSRIAAEQASNVKLLVQLSRQLLAATRDNKPNSVAVYAP